MDPKWTHVSPDPGDVARVDSGGDADQEDDIDPEREDPPDVGMREIPQPEPENRSARRALKRDGRPYAAMVRCHMLSI